MGSRRTGEGFWKGPVVTAQGWNGLTLTECRVRLDIRKKSLLTFYGRAVGSWDSSWRSEKKKKSFLTLFSWGLILSLIMLTAMQLSNTACQCTLHATPGGLGTLVPKLEEDLKPPQAIPHLHRATAVALLPEEMPCQPSGIAAVATVLPVRKHNYLHKEVKRKTHTAFLEHRHRDSPK